MPVRIVTAGGSPVRVVTSGGDPVRIVTSGVSDPVRVTGACGIAPAYSSGEVGNVDDTTVVVTFSSDITAPCGDYALGFTIYINGVADAITAAVLSASDTISFTVTTAIVNGDAVTISYDSVVGCITESCGVTDLETFAGESVTNNVVSAIWYRAGGAPMPIAAYQPKGAANLAASYVNLVNPGTYDAAPGTAPTFNAATGWTFNGSTQYLVTGVIPGPLPGWTMLVQCSSFTIGVSKSLMGMYDSAAPTGFFIIQSNSLTVMRTFDGSTSANYCDNGPAFVSGNYAVAHLTAYRNGIAEANAISGSAASTPNRDIYIGAINLNGSAGQYAASVIAAIAIYNTAVDAGIWVPAVAAAMAAL